MAEKLWDEKGRFTETGWDVYLDAMDGLFGGRSSGMIKQAVQFGRIDFYPDDPAISDNERFIMRTVLKKLETCARAKAKLGDLYELQTLTKLNVSCEMVGFNNEGEVYLVQRLSKEEKSDEPYPLQWNAPGTGIEPYEHWEDVFIRVARKFGKNVVLEGIKFVSPLGYPPIAHDPPRGPYLLCIFIASIYGNPDNPRGRFFGHEEMFQLNLVESHKNIILPTAIQAHNLAHCPTK